MKYRRSPCSLSVVFLSVAILATCASAQLALDKTGGALGGSLSFKLTGTPGNTYVLIGALTEQPTTVAGMTFDIPLTNLLESFSIPGFVGVLNGAGTAQPTILVPNDPALDPLVISLQAAAGTALPWTVSNLVRVTPSLPGAFEPALNAPMAPIVGGGIAAAPDGEVLFVGGSGPIAQKYNSRIEEWELAGLTFGVGLFGQTTGLADGRVLFTGGLDAAGQPTNAAAIYDPVTLTTTPLTMNSVRAGHGASLMGNGKVLITGGFVTFDLTNLLAFLTGVQGSTEIFDPTTLTFTPGPTLLEPRGLHTSTTLSNGQVLIAGGVSVLPIINVPTISATAYRFNPATNTFGFPSVMSGGRFLHSAIGLSNGKVLIAGGVNVDLTQFLLSGDPATIVVGTLTDCQVYTQTLFGGSFATVTGMAEGRAGAGLAALPNGGALIAGGVNVTFDIPNAAFVLAPSATADRFSSSPSNAIAPTGPMAAARFLPVTANLPDGTVMVVGGGGAGAEIFQP